MPLFEDDTLEGAIKKATLGLRKPKYGSFDKTSSLAMRSLSAPKSRIRHRVETFDDRRYRSRIGSGRGGFGSIAAAVRAASSEMGHAAGNAYPDRVAAIKRGERQRSVMIPELAARILVDDWRNLGSGNERYSYDGLYVGRRQPNGSGEFALPRSANIVAILHAHWMDNNASSDDTRNKTATANYVRQDRGPNSGRVEVQFYIYSLRGGVTGY